MRTALDTNVISALWGKEQSSVEIYTALDEAQAHGGLVVCAPVYCELLAHPGASGSFVQKFFFETEIAIEFDLDEDIWREAGTRFARHASRRRRAAKTEPKRLLVDFLIGAHALRRADRLMTRDRARYKLDFPELELV